MNADMEFRLATIIWQAWFELNAIHARDGAPSGVSEEYFEKVVDDCEAALESLGYKAMPWPPSPRA